MTIVISTHLDDAVWSAAGLCQGATVVTICAGVPNGDIAASRFDEGAFDTARDAMIARRHEDIDAAHLLGFTPIHMDVFDLAYGREECDIRRAVAVALGEVGKEAVIGPVGIHHPDHIVVSDAFRDVVKSFGLNGWLYEDLPYARLFPGENKMRAYGMKRGIGRRLPEDEKRKAVETYKSQIHWTTHMEEILGPEHYWRL